MISACMFISCEKYNYTNDGLSSTYNSSFTNDELSSFSNYHSSTNTLSGSTDDGLLHVVLTTKVLPIVDRVVLYLNHNSTIVGLDSAYNHDFYRSWN